MNSDWSVTTRGPQIVYVITCQYCPALHSVITDTTKAASGVNHLAGHGHRQIGFISGRRDETTGFERLTGYRRAMELNRLPVSEDLIVFGDYKEKSGYTGMVSLLDKNPGMTAVYISSSKMTYGALKALTDRGIRVPEDMALIGYDVHDSSGLIRPGITTIVQNEEQIGRLCVESLRAPSGPESQRYRQSADPAREPRLIIRETCGCKNSR